MGGHRRGGRRTLWRPGRAGRSGSTSIRRPLHRRSSARCSNRGAFEARSPSTRRAITGGWSRRPRQPTASPHDELLVGAGADEILDLVAKTFLAAGARAVIPAPTYAMYRVITEQRAASAVVVPRLGPEAGYALDVPATTRAAADAAVVWLCSPNNPTGLAEPEGAIAAAAGRDRRRRRRRRPRARDRRPRRGVRRVRRARRCSACARDHPNLVVVRTASKAYALAGLRVGFAVARAATIDRMTPYRPPGSVSTVSVSAVTAALRDPTGMRAERRPGRRRARLAHGRAP